MITNGISPTHYRSGLVTYIAQVSASVASVVDVIDYL